MDTWSCNYFSLSNAEGENESNLPLLFRRIAGEMESRGIEAADILDVAISNEPRESGPWWTVTVYWSPDAPN
jgi:hypothetical protein